MSAKALRSVRTVLAAACVAALSLVLLPLNSDYQEGVATAAQQDNSPVQLEVAVVNEDAGAVFNGEQVNLGRAYAVQLESDTSASWHVVSRGVAENGLTYANYQLMVIIPTDFSAKLTDIDAIDPAPIGVIYQANGGGNSRVEAVAQALGQRVVSQLNSQLVDMYVASILGNLHQAQDNVRALTDVELVNRDVQVDELTPATLALGDDLDVLTQGSQALGSESTSLVDSLDGVGESLDHEATAHGEHAVSLTELLADLEAGSLSYAQFMTSLMSMNADLLGDQVQAMYDELVALGDQIAVQFTLDSESTTHAAHLQTLRERVDAVTSAVDGRRAELAAFSDEALLDAYRSQAFASVDQDGDGRITVRDLIGYMQGGTTDPMVDDALSGAVQAAVSRLPYRDRAAFDQAVADGDLGQAGDFDELVADISADLDVILGLEAGSSIPADPGGVVGADLDQAILRLTEAREAASSVPVEGPEGEDDGSGETSEPEDIDPTSIDELADAAADYGSIVSDIAAAYRSTVVLIDLQVACGNSCNGVLDTDVSAALDPVIVAAVDQQIAAEKQALAGISADIGAVQLTIGQLTGSFGALTESSDQLSANITDQVASLASLRAQMDQILTDEEPVNDSLTSTAQTAEHIAAEAKSLLAASESVLLSSQSTRDQAERLTQSVDSLSQDVDGLTSSSVQLSDQSGELSDALTQQVNDSQIFADSFGGVLANSHSSGVLNERLLSFLSAPVTSSAREPVESSDVSRPFPWVLITFALSFAAAAVLAGIDQRRRTRSAFGRTRVEWLGPNLRALAWAGVVGVLIGLIVAWLSAKDLDVAREAQLAWGTCVVLCAAESTLATHWLLRQWRTVGVGLSMLLVVGYVFVSNAVGFGSRSGVSGVVAAIDPLAHAESAMSRILGDGSSALSASAPLLWWSLGFAVLTVLIQPDLRRLLPSRFQAVEA